MPLVTLSFFLQDVFVFGNATSRCKSFQSLLTNDGQQFPVVSFDIMKDLALLPYSSGTTGRPKGVMLSHYNVLFNIMQCG